MLGHLEVNIEVSDTGIETTESNDCRGISGNNRNANDVLAMTQERARFFHKDR